MRNALDLLISHDPRGGTAVLRQRLAELLGAESLRGRLVAQRRLRGSVLRVGFQADGHIRRFIIKRLRTNKAMLNEWTIRRWLPAVGLDDSGPPLLDACPDGNRHVWHIYDDLGDCALREDAPDRDCVRAAVRLIAAIHRRFALHPLLAECRQHGSNLGAEFVRASVTDAIRALEALCSSARRTDADVLPLCERLLDRIGQLHQQHAERTSLLLEHGGPETLLHGDLWPMNVLVTRTPHGLQARLIDWDRAGVGPPVYDLSTFLSRFPRPDRPWILDLYREEMATLWSLPEPPILNALFDTSQCARLAHCVIWPALELIEDDATWAFDELREVDEWFEQMEPRLLDNESCVAVPRQEAP